MARKARDSKGRFVKKGRARSRTRRRRNPSTKRRTTRRRTTAARKSPRRRRTYRRNPPKLHLFDMLKGGVIDAAGLVVGEASARTLPTVLSLPKQGAVGLAVQVATALLVSIAGDRFVGADAGRMLLAGGLSAPLKTVIVAKNVPFLAPALSPASQSAGLSSYAGWGGLRGYVPAPRAAATPRTGMGSYVEYNEEIHG